MQRDLNDWRGSGVIHDAPKLITLKSGQRLLSFTFLVIEHFTLANGHQGRHENYFTIEALGKQAENYHRELVVGGRYQIKGYLRVEELHGVEKVRVRCFNIVSDVVDVDN